MQRIIRQPESLEDAVKQFKAGLRRGELPIHILAVWQRNLFDQDDALIYAEVVRVNGTEQAR